MTHAARMQTILEMRNRKVDQIGNQAARARAQLARCRAELEACEHRLEETSRQGSLALDEMMKKVAHVEGKRMRLQEIQIILLGQREAQDQARRDYVQAKRALIEAEQKLDEVSAELNAATGRAKAVGTLVERETKQAAARQETLEEEEQLDDFAAQAHNDKQGGLG